MHHNKQQIVDAVLRKDLLSFIQKSFNTITPAKTFKDNWHLEGLAWRLEECRKGNIKRLLITLPPRNLKSVCASIAFPAYILGKDPTKRVVCVSYAADLAETHARECRTIMLSNWYKRIFPGTTLSRDKNTKSDFITSRGGGRYSTSTGGTLTGRGGDFIIIDDPMKPNEALSDKQRASTIEWYKNTLYSRLDDKQTGCIIIIMQRLHVDDLAGYVLDNDDWEQYNLPAISEENQNIQIGPNKFYEREIGEALNPKHEPIHVLEKVKKGMGTMIFSAQYQQRPVPLDGGIFKWSWFQFFDNPPQKQRYDQIIQSWDTASKSSELSSYSVCTTLLRRDGRYYLLGIFRERLNFPDLRRAAEEMASKYKPDVVLIEDKASGTGLIQDLRNNTPPYLSNIIPIKPDGDKVTRASNISHIIEAQNVFLPRSADWLEEFKKEIIQFPNGRHDDQIDSLSQALQWSFDPEPIPRIR